MVSFGHITAAFTALLLSCSSLLAERLPLNVVQNISREIDHIIEQNNQKSSIAPNPLIDDATFLRRSYLNVIGRIPTYDETKSFLDNRSGSKRVKLIDSLVYSEGFSSHLFNFYANLLRLQSEQAQFGLGWDLWLKKVVKENMPYDQLVREMLSASGHCATTPAVGYYLRDRGMLLDNISNTSKVFLGTQIGCAQCHDHPFEDWTQKQYYQLASYGAKIEYRSDEARNKVKEVVDFKNSTTAKGRNKQNKIRKEARDLRTLFRNFNNNSIASNPNRSLRLPKDYKYNDGKPGERVQPAVLFGSPTQSNTENPPHHQLASWVTDRSNPMFSKVIVNRLWRHALGYGLVEPTDNWTDRSKISHPEVLDLLVEVLHESGFDTRETLRVIYHTQLFQRACYSAEVTNGRKHDFRGPVLRRMSAEQIYDSLLTLEKGNIDTSENTSKLQKWQNYVTSIQKILSSKPAEIIKLDEAIDKTENATREFQQQARKLRSEKSKAQQDGNQSKANRIQKDLTQLQKKIRATRREKRPSEATKISPALQNRLRVNHRGPLRASELSSPFRPGSFMRDFGASDRNTTNAQHTQASIPQALAMLNGQRVVQLSAKKGTLSKLIRKAKRPEERLTVLFLSIYNAYPTKEEAREFKHIVESRLDVPILAKAMLNSKRFLFIQ